MVGSSPAHRFGTEVRKCREGRSLSQEQLAERAGVHRTFVGRIERGETNITLQNILRIARALGIKASRLLESLD